ncbi:nucleoside deaminase [Tunicatimonas pelagia]|uniref:nucleoside deaminase n=1 Tax=Tunicatimonas pelagia TaxID=931531 RepID=UPI00266546E8|nr:nucleoside deaminase [Tunicatimonas pelagia]WKN43618.1 nucleoside deaminase [Tunicatimonas pelagia]
MAKTQWKEYMQTAVQQAQNGKTPFGCVIVQNGAVIAQAHNTVSASHDPTAHGEVNAIRQACQQNQSQTLPETVLFTTGEPCPMCMSAILYAKIPQVVFGASIATIAQFMPQITISCQQVAAHSPQKVSITGLFMEKECSRLLQEFG